jgi:ribosomal protein S18 acetylase RimI-like enzyme
MVSGAAEPSSYAAVETLRDARTVAIRALKPDDREDLSAAVKRTSAQSLFRRFFGPKRGFTEQEIAYYLNVDFVTHVALVAVVDEAGRAAIVGGGRYIVLQPGRAEVAFAVVDQYQGLGIGAALFRHLAVMGRRAGLQEFVAEVLPDNEPMLRMFKRSGLQAAVRHDAGVVHVSLSLA